MTELRKGAKEVYDSKWAMWIIGTMLSLIGVMFAIIIALVSITYNNIQTSLTNLDFKMEQNDKRINETHALTAQNSRDIANIVGGVYNLHAAKHEPTLEIPNPND